MKQNSTQETTTQETMQHDEVISPKSFTTAICMPTWLKHELDNRRENIGLSRNDMMLQILMGKYPPITTMPAQVTDSNS